MRTLVLVTHWVSWIELNWQVTISLWTLLALLIVMHLTNELLPKIICWSTMRWGNTWMVLLLLSFQINCWAIINECLKFSWIKIHHPKWRFLAWRSLKVCPLVNGHNGKSQLISSWHLIQVNKAFPLTDHQWIIWIIYWPIFKSKSKSKWVKLNITDRRCYLK